MAQAQDINMKVKVDTGQAESATTNYKKTLKDLKDQMVELEVSTNGLSEATEEQRAQYLALQEQAASITDALGDVNARVKTASDDFRGMNAALEGLKGGAAVAQGLVGTLDLLGVEAPGVENVVKTLMSLQGVMNSINAVQAIFNKDSKVRIALQKLMTTTTVTQTTATGAATVAQRALNAAMNAMPILAIVSAAALLITALTKIAKKNKETAETTDEATDSQKKFFDALNQLNWKYADVEAAARQYIDIINSTTATDERKAAALKELNTLLGTEGITLKNANQAWNDYAGGVLSAQKNLDSLIERQKKEKEEGINDLQTTQAIAGAKVILSEAQEKLKEKYKALTKATKEQKKEVEEETEAVKKYADEIVRVNELHNDQTADVTRSMEEQYKIREAYMQGDLASLKEYSAEWLATNKALLENQKEADIAALNAEYAAGTMSKELLEAEKYRIEEEYKAKEKELVDEQTNYLKEQEEKQTETLKEEEEKRLQLTTSRIETVGAIMQQASNFISELEAMELAEYEGNEKKQKEIKKKYATAKALTDIAQIGVQTALGIMSVWPAAMQLGPIAGPILGAILTAMIGFTGIAQTAKATQEAAKIKQAGKGAYVVGASHQQGGVMYELEGGEVVLNKRAMAIPQYRSLASAMNVSTGGVAFPGASSSGVSIINKEDLRLVVSETVAAVTAIPVVVSEQSITNAQRRVNVMESHSRF